MQQRAKKRASRQAMLLQGFYFKMLPWEPALISPNGGLWPEIIKQIATPPQVPELFLIGMFRANQIKRQTRTLACPFLSIDDLVVPLNCHFSSYTTWCWKHTSFYSWFKCSCSRVCQCTAGLPLRFHPWPLWTLLICLHFFPTKPWVGLTVLQGNTARRSTSVPRQKFALEPLIILEPKWILNSSVQPRLPPQCPCEGQKELMCLQMMWWCLQHLWSWSLI